MPVMGSVQKLHSRIAGAVPQVEPVAGGALVQPAHKPLALVAGRIRLWLLCSHPESIFKIPLVKTQAQGQGLGRPFAKRFIRVQQLRYAAFG